MVKKTKNKPQVRFREPKITGERYHTMYGHELYDLCDKVSRMNASWVRKNLNGTTAWAIVRAGEVVNQGYSQVYPSAYAIRELARPGKLAYLIKRPAEE